MTDQSPNDIFHSSSFLQGHNQEYVEQLHANYAKDPASVDESWQEFFAALGEETEAAKAAAGSVSLKTLPKRTLCLWPM